MSKPADHEGKRKWIVLRFATEPYEGCVEHVAAYLYRSNHAALKAAERANKKHPSWCYDVVEVLETRPDAD